MKTKEELDEFLHEMSLESSLYFSEEETIPAIIGWDINTSALIYDRDLLTVGFANHFRNCDDDKKPIEEYYEEANEWIEYNTLRSLPYKQADYIAFDKDNNEIKRISAYAKDAKEEALNAAGSEGHIEYVDYVNPIVMQSITNYVD